MKNRNLRVYTAQYGYNGENRLDITVKTGLQMFAPTWEMVQDYKEKRIDKDQYTELYYAKMRNSFKTHRETWEWLLDQKEVVLVCFCKNGDFCHRYLLSDILAKLGATYMGEKTFDGVSWRPNESGRI